MKRKTLCSIILILLLTNIKAQNDLLKRYEDSLKYINKTLASNEQDISKKQANEKFIRILERALSLPNSYNYPFDSLLTISKLISPDKKFRIFSWATINEGGKYNYYGIIQMRSSNKKIFTLKDKTDSLGKPDNLILSYENWYGGVYYKIIYEKYKNNEYYTLLGWQGNNLSTRKKIIDVLTFNKEDIPSFGAPIFKTERAEPSRIIFEYSADAVMSLKYEQQYYNKIKGQSIYASDKLKTKPNKYSKKNCPKY